MRRAIFNSLLSLTLLSASSSLTTLVRVRAQDTSLAKVLTAFAIADIPEDAGITFYPDVLLDVAFPQTSGAPPLIVSAGEVVQRNQTALPPHFFLSSPFPSIQHQLLSGNQTFVISMLDLDAPTPQNRSLAQIRHFLGANYRVNVSDSVPGSSGGNLSVLVNTTEALSLFIQPTPPLGSDPHRYVFLLFNQPPNFNEIVGQFVNASSPFTNFDIATFARQTGLGDPLGGTYMLVGPDPSEPQLQ